MSITTQPKKLTWLITGCTSGFGLSLSRLVLANGHTLIATSRHAPHPSLITSITSSGGRWLTLDVSSPSSAQLITSLSESGIEIDVLVNNAGYCDFRIIENVKEEEVRGQMETMFFGPVRLMQAVLPGMRKRRFGVVVNFSSGAALDGNPTMGVYAGAKAGLDGMLKTLLLIVGRGLREVNGMVANVHRSLESPRERSRAVQYPRLDCCAGDL